MTCIITWNKDKWPEGKMQDLMDRFATGEEVVERWKCGAYKKYGLGDRVFLSRTGKHSPGLIGSGKIASPPRLEEDFEDPNKKVWYVDIRFDYLSQSTTMPVASHEELAGKLGTNAMAFTPQKSGHPYPGNDIELEALWDKLTGNAELIYPDEAGVDENDGYQEGSKKKVLVNKYERDSEARKRCIEVHGTRCKACKITFGVVYGPDLGKNYIHVHHIVPLKSIGKEYTVDPVKDLVPLCPNCHAMIHQVDPPLTVSALKSRIMVRYRNLFN